MTDLDLAVRFDLAARQLLRAAKRLSAQLPEASGNRDICDARRCIEHHQVRLKELGKELDKRKNEWPPLPGGR
jgi:hypothetical protein